MGVDTKLYLHRDISIAEVYTFIDQTFENVERYTYEKGSIEDTYSRISLTHNGESRDISVGRYQSDADQRGLPDYHITLSLGNNQTAIDVMRIIANQFGGWLEENDCDGNDPYFIEGKNMVNIDPLMVKILEITTEKDKIKFLYENWNIIKDVVNKD